MYYINQVTASFNYDENVVTTTLFAHSMDDENVLYKKIVPTDLSDEEIKRFTRTWSLTTLSISTGIDTSELISKFGKSFKHCFVRYKANSVFYDFKQKTIQGDGIICVSLESDFPSSFEFHLHFDSPMPDDFMKQLELSSVVGYSKL